MPYLAQWLATVFILLNAFLFGIWGATSETFKQRLLFRVLAFTFSLVAMVLALVLHYGTVILMIDLPVVAVKATYSRMDGYVLERHYFQTAYLLFPALITLSGYLTGKAMQTYLHNRKLKGLHLG